MKSGTILSALFAAAIFSFWMWLYPQGPNYQEQNQLFLWTGGYLIERLTVAGGLADFISECIVQFFYLRWAGAAIMALLAVAMQKAVMAASSQKRANLRFLSFITPAIWTLMCGDMEYLLSYPVALTAALFLCKPFERAGWHKLWAAPIVWWLIGPMAFIPVLYSIATNLNLKELAMAIWTLVSSYLMYRLFLMQYPTRDVAFGINYYRVADVLQPMQVILPVIALACALVSRYEGKKKLKPIIDTALTVIIIASPIITARYTYDRQSWEIMAYSMLERNSNFKEILKRAEKYQPEDAVSATYVNYALVMEGEMEKKMWHFHQCGTKGLIMPSVRDNMSDVASCDILWMIGMTNTSLQYAFDLQESIQNARKSGRFTSRIAECHIVNGHYEIARRYLDKLTHTIFYRKWAMERLAMINDGDDGVDRDPVYRYLRRAGFQTDFIANYASLDLMMALLYKENNSNIAAALYYKAWQELKQAEQQRDEEESYTAAHGS